MPNDKKLLGAFGEDAACAFLKKKGYKIVGRNFSCRFGEIDIIACNRHYVAFVEVKMRKNASFATAAEFVTRDKQRRIITTAQLWLSRNPSRLQPRFDVIEVYAPQGLSTSTPEIHHIEDAYQL
jgi:putative endonuclease